MIGEINNRPIYMYHKKINDVNCLLLRCPLLKEGGGCPNKKQKKFTPPPNFFKKIFQRKTCHICPTSHFPSAEQHLVYTW